MTAFGRGVCEKRLGLINARKKTSTCAVSNAFENPLLSEGASRPGFGSHYRVGLQAPVE